MQFLFWRTFVSSNDNVSSCVFTYSDGRQCRMLRSSRRSQFCFYHERKLRHLRESDHTAAEICEPLSNDFVPATALTQSLTRAMRAVAEGHLYPKCATALARVASTLLKSIEESTKEFQECYKDGPWRQLTHSHHTNLPIYESDDKDDEDDDSDDEDDVEGEDNVTSTPALGAAHSKLPETGAEFAAQVGL
jgi:hypothetical protein